MALETSKLYQEALEAAEEGEEEEAEEDDPEEDIDGEELEEGEEGEDQEGEGEEEEEEEEDEADQGDSDGDEGQEYEDEVEVPVKKPKKKSNLDLRKLANVAEAQVEKAKRNSSTNKAVWNTFIRQIRNRKTFPVALAPAFAKNKTDLFNVWLDEDKDWDKCFDENQRFFDNQQRTISDNDQLNK